VSRKSIAIGLLVVAGCVVTACAANQESAGQPAPATTVKVPTVSEALSSNDPAEVSVRGYVLARPDGTAWLCTGMAGSFPPQCGEPSLELTGLDATQLPDHDPASGVRWSGETTVAGVLRENVLELRQS
jgi:hypothetical protein